MDANSAALKPSRPAAAAAKGGSHAGGGGPSSRQRRGQLLGLGLACLLYLAAGLALYGPTLSLDWQLLDEPGDTYHAFLSVERFLHEPSLGHLRAEKDPIRLTPVYYLWHYGQARLLGLSATRHHAVSLALLAVHLVALAALFRRLCASAWWAAPAVFFYLLFLPSEYNSTAYNFYGLTTIEPLMIALVTTYCGLAAWTATAAARTTTAGAPASALGRAAWALGLVALAFIIFFLKETASFYSLGVLALAVVLWRRGADQMLCAAAAGAYALAGCVFVACYLTVIGWNTHWATSVQPGDTMLGRARWIGWLFVDNYGLLLVVIPGVYALLGWARGQHRRRPDVFPAVVDSLHLDVDVVAWAFFLPPLVQLVLWPNFQPRLLLPHAYLLAVLLGLALWRLARLLAGSAGQARSLPRLALALALLAGLSVPIFAFNSLLSLNNFKTLYLTNETVRVRGYQLARGLLRPDSRLLVAIMHGDQIFYEIGWRLHFFDKLPNAVLELQPGGEKPRPHDVIYYHEQMARVRLSGKALESHTVRQSGEIYIHTGWCGLAKALLRGASALETRRGSNQYEIVVVRSPPSAQ